jgi:hypothetical protein
VEFGWYKTGGPEIPGSILDLNRLPREAEWDRDLKRWVLPASFPVEFLSPDLYRQRPVEPGVCWGCQTPFDLCLPSFSARQKIARMRGPCSKRDFSFAAPLQTHLQSLGLAVGKAPEELLLCPDCTIRYVKELRRQRILKGSISPNPPTKKKTRKPK